MIKFFRKIRQKLLSENRLSQYLLYAVGEIALVVIGILIALQINNWNNNRVKSNQMSAYLMNLQSDLKADTLNLSVKINSYKTFIAYKQLLKLTSFEHAGKDSLVNSIIPLHDLYLPVQTTFDKIINSGITRISNNDSLSRIIYDYYTTNLHLIKIMNDWEDQETSKDADYWLREQDIYELDATDLPNLQEDSIIRTNLIRLLSTTKARNNLKQAYDRKIRMLETYEDLRTLASQLIMEIEKELEKG